MLLYVTKFVMLYYYISNKKIIIKLRQSNELYFPSNKTGMLLQSAPQISWAGTTHQNKCSADFIKLGKESQTYSSL